jgi:hypothetical protein
MRTHATSRIGETGLKIFNGFLIFFNGFPNFLNGFPIFLNSFLLSKKSKEIYLQQEVYKRSLFELCIFFHSLSHSRSELRNTRYNTQQPETQTLFCMLPKHFVNQGRRLACKDGVCFIVIHHKKTYVAIKQHEGKFPVQSLYTTPVFLLAKVLKQMTFAIYSLPMLPMKARLGPSSSLARIRPSMMF